MMWSLIAAAIIQAVVIVPADSMQPGQLGTIYCDEFNTPHIALREGLNETVKKRVMVHESVHLKQAKEMGCDKFLSMPLVAGPESYNRELPAWCATTRYMVEKEGFNPRLMMGMLARTLFGHTRGVNFKEVYKDAEECLKEYLN